MPQTLDMPASVPPAATLGQRVRRAIAITIGGQMVTQGLRLASNLILARLLVPEAFGLMAVVNLWIAGIEMISNVGIQPAIVRHARGEDPTFLDTAWSVQAMRGVLLCGIASALSLPIARFYGEPQLAPLLSVASVGTLLLGLASTKLVVRLRRLDLARVTAIEASAQIAALVATVGLALVYRSVWALVLGGLANAVVRLVLSWVALPGRGNRFAWDRAALDDLLGFGRWVLVSTLFTFLATRIDIALLGKLLPLGALGVYGIAMQVPTLLRDVSGRIIQTVLMPSLSEAQRESPGALAASFERAQRQVLALGALAIGAVAVGSPVFFALLYDERYRDASWIAPLSAIPLWFSYLHDASGRALLALGDSRGFAFANIVRTIAAALGCWFGFAAGELPGLILGSAAGGLVGYGAVALGLRAHGLGVARLDLAWSAAGLAAGAACAGVVARLGPDPHGLIALAVGAAVLLPYALWVALQLRRERSAAA